jgi:coenzyme F420-reducing hydrogenase gamma subunit
MYMDTYSDDRSQGPLETLIFKQLSALLTGEKMLEKRYQSLNEANPLESSKFETEVLALHQRADRLQRMIEAMGCGTCSEFGYDGDPLAA